MTDKEQIVVERVEQKEGKGLGTGWMLYCLYLDETEVIAC